MDRAREIELGGDALVAYFGSCGGEDCPVHNCDPPDTCRAERPWDGAAKAVLEAVVGEGEIVRPAAGCATWAPGDKSLAPRACPECGSIGTGLHMPSHIGERHPDALEKYGLVRL